MNNKFERFLNKIGGLLPRYFKEVILYGSILTMIFSLFVFSSKPILAYSLLWTKGGILSGQVWRMVTFVFDNFISTSPFEIFSILFLYYALNKISQNKGVNFINGYFLFNIVLFNILGFIHGYVIFAPVINMLFVIYALQNPWDKMYFNFFIPLPMWVFALLILFRIHTTTPIFELIVIDTILVLLTYNRVFDYIKQRGRKATYNKKVNEVNKKFYIHKCEVCGRTDVSNPELSFRYCSKCQGNFEYCEDHINNHEHKSNIISLDDKINK